MCRIENTLGSAEWPTRVRGELVSGNYFGVLAAKPFAGRLLTVDDDRIPSRHPVIVLGYDFWRRSFRADPAVIGHSIRLGRNDYTVIGVASPGFRGRVYLSDFWIPLMMLEQVFERDLLPRADVPLVQTVGLPHAGATSAQIQGLAQGLKTYASKDGWHLTVFPAIYLKFWPAYRAAAARFLGLFLGLSACILIIACANLASLLLARAGERQRELAIRQALGATRRQLVRRLAAESVILTLLGGATGLLLAYWAASFVERVPLPVPARIGLTPDARLAGISLAISFIAAVLFTVMSASKGLGRHIQSVLASSAATLAPQTGAQSALVIAQLALSCLLLTVSGLLLRSALNIERIDVGFDAVNGVIGMIGLSDQGYTAATGAVFYRRLEEDLPNQPQIEAVALGWLAPTAPIRAIGSFSIAEGNALPSRYNVVGSRYFATLGIPLLAGREFEATDRQTSEPVAIVNETLAARYHGHAVGETLTIANEPSPRRIVGVVREIKYNGIAEPPQPFVYLPLSQVFRPDVYVHVRTHAPGAEEILRNRLRTLDRNVALSDVHTLSEQLDEARVTPRASASFSLGAAFIAVCLALVGVYGVLATSVDRRQRESAIRAALGAARFDIMKGVMLEGMRLTVAGLALGMLASVAAGRVLTDLLYGVPSRDVTVFALVPLVILGVSVCAWIAPARRAGSLDPVAILNSH